MSFVSDLISPITGLLDKFIPDATEKAKLAYDIATLAEKQSHENNLAQIEVNKLDSQSSNPWQSGWRPFIGWTCGTGFAYGVVLRPMVVDAYIIVTGVVPALPPLDMNQIITMLGGLLGLGTMRTVEYVKGVMKK